MKKQDPHKEYCENCGHCKGCNPHVSEEPDEKTCAQCKWCYRG